MKYFENNFKGLLNYSEDEYEAFCNVYNLILKIGKQCGNKFTYYGTDSYFYNLFSTFFSNLAFSDNKVYLITILFFNSVSEKERFTYSDQSFEVLSIAYDNLLQYGLITEQEHRKLFSILRVLKQDSDNEDLILLKSSDLLLESDLSYLKDLLLFCSPLDTSTGTMYYYGDIFDYKVTYNGTKPEHTTFIDCMYTRLAIINSSVLKDLYRTKIKDLVEAMSKKPLF